MAVLQRVQTIREDRLHLTCEKTGNVTSFRVVTYEHDASERFAG